MASRMNVLLVYPKNPDTFWSFKHLLRFVSERFRQAIKLAIIGYHFRRIAGRL